VGFTVTEALPSIKGAAFLIAVKKATSFGERVQKRKKADFGDDC
jgi:hypothetical protein